MGDDTPAPKRKADVDVDGSAAGEYTTTFSTSN
jgi:hypothetical protein